MGERRRVAAVEADDCPPVCPQKLLTNEKETRSFTFLRDTSDAVNETLERDTSEYSLSRYDEY